MIQVLARDGTGSGYFTCTKWKTPTEEAGRALQLCNTEFTFWVHVSREHTLHADSAGSILSCLGADSGLIGIF